MQGDKCYGRWKRNPHLRPGQDMTGSCPGKSGVLSFPWEDKEAKARVQNVQRTGGVEQGLQPGGDE